MSSELGGDARDDLLRVGLCVRCAHVHVVESRRRSRFYRCTLADIDPAFLRYPPLPVLSCTGFTRKSETAAPEGT